MPVTNWACIKCGVTNPKNFFKCQTCQQPKPIFWECAACKVKNPTASLKCTGCKRKRPSIYANTVNVKDMSKVKFNNVSQSRTSGGGSAADLPCSTQSSTLPPGGSTISGIGCPVGSTLSQATPNSTMSTLSQSVSSYDIFVKLNKPNRTVKQFSYVDSEEKYNQTIENCAKTNGLFSDPSFKPSLYSLYFDPKQMKQDKPRVYWLRPKDMRPAEIVDPKSPVLKLPWAVIREPVADDITQGVLGNCWLLSALAVLVEKPVLLDKVLATKELTSAGAYRVRLYRDGRLISVIVDDQMPCTNRRLLIYSCAKRKQLFVPIIEKAMARMYGCYESLVSGQTCEGLSALTGYPCRSIRTQVVPAAQPKAEEEAMLEPDYIWTLLLSFQSAGFLMGAGCGSSTDCQIEAEEYEQKGLVMQHAYTVLDVINAPDVRLLQLRNPWGRQVWTGDWSDESSNWTDELREQLKPNRAQEGVFWVSFSDFQRYFEKVDVCKIRSDWHELRYEGYFPSSCADLRYLSVFEVQVEEASTELEITLHQESRRAVNLYKTPLLPICVAIFQLKDVQMKTCGDLVDFSGYKIREFLGCDVMLDKGVYLIAIYAYNHWNSSGSNTKGGHTLRPRFVVSLHSSRLVTINCHCPAPTMQGDTMIELVTAKGRKKQHDDNVFSYYLTCTDNWSGLVVVIENCHNDSYLEVIFDAAESTNLHSTRGSLMTQDTIPPKSRQLVNVLSHLDPATAYYLSYQMSYRVSSQAATNHNPDLGPLVSLHSPRSFKQIRS